MGCRQICLLGRGALMIGALAAYTYCCWAGDNPGLALTPKLATAKRATDAIPAAPVVPSGQTQATDSAAAPIPMSWKVPLYNGQDAFVADAPSADKPQPTPAKRPRPDVVESPAPASRVVPAEEPAARGDSPAPTPAALSAEKQDDVASAPAEAKPAEAPLAPIADPLEVESIEPEAASLKGVTPGVSTPEDVDAAWGMAKEIRKVDGATVQLYAVPPFSRIEVTFTENKATAIVVRLEKAFPADVVAKQLELNPIRPVFVENELGEILGQAYPERGVLFTFEPGADAAAPARLVSEIVLEPITAEPFVLRAESTLDTHARASLRDVEQAMKIESRNPRALWVRAKLLSLAGDQEKAAASIAAAVAVAPDNPQYRITRAQILAQTGKTAAAVKEAKTAVELSKSKPHLKARAVCLLGDLVASGAKPDYRQSYSYHEEAAKIASALVAQRHPAVRIAAKEVMLDAYLGAANDSAWGSYTDKEKAVKVWLDLASGAADDLIAKEGMSEELRFRVATRAIAACVGLRGAVSATEWAQKAVTSGQILINNARDAVHKNRYEWDLGVALYDALQTCQLRRDHEGSLKVGGQAVEYLEAAEEQRRSPASAYLLGRLYFRLGAIHAIRDKDHAGAVEWFDKAVVQFDKPMPPEVAADLARQGETMVIMGVSYWDVGQREKSVAMTTRGVEMMEKAVKQGAIAESSLAIPYGNLAAMHKQLGKTESAGRYEKMASKAKSSNLK